MNFYRVTFHAANGISFSSILMALNSEELKKIIHKKINDEDYFEMESKNNKRALVNKENIGFIETEMLFSENGLKIEDLSQYNDSELQIIFNSFSDINIIVVAFSLSNNSSILKERIIKSLNEDNRKLYEDDMKNVWDITLSEIVDARKLIISNVISLQEQEQIRTLQLE